METKIVLGKVGRVITGAKSIVIKNGKTYVDGKCSEDLDMNKMNDRTINVTITGSIENLEIDTCDKVHVNGDVKRLSTTSGDVDVKGNVTGCIQTASGDVDVDGSVDGNITTASGDVSCGRVSGSASTMTGDVCHK